MAQVGDERSSDFYDSAYLAEYYDCWTISNIESLKTQADAAIYWTAFEHLRRARKPTSSDKDRFLILDIGTGTGRCLHNLAADAHRVGLDLADTEFIGLDTSPQMIERAGQKTLATPVGSLSWVVGSALKLESIPGIDKGNRKVDFLLFAVGSISHLHEVGQPEQFLQEVAKVLRPGSARAYIPIQNELISKRHVTAPEPLPESGGWSVLNVAEDFQSRLYPGIIYRQTPIEESTTAHDVRTDKYHLLVVKRGPDGEESIVENNSIEIKLRLWDEKEWVGMIQSAGLKLAEILNSSHETYYVLQLP